MKTEELSELLARHREWIDAGMPIEDPRRADLHGAYLREADLSGAKDGAVCRLDFGGWSICVRSTETAIGCQRRKNDDWLSWSPESPKIVRMHVNAPEWWRVHGEAVKACIRCVMAKAGMEVVT